MPQIETLRIDALPTVEVERIYVLKVSVLFCSWFWISCSPGSWLMVLCYSDRKGRRRMAWDPLQITSEALPAEIFNPWVHLGGAWIWI